MITLYFLSDNSAISFISVLALIDGLSSFNLKFSCFFLVCKRFFYQNLDIWGIIMRIWILFTPTHLAIFL